MIVSWVSSIFLLTTPAAWSSFADNKSEPAKSQPNKGDDFKREDVEPFTLANVTSVALSTDSALLDEFLLLIVPPCKEI